MKNLILITAIISAYCILLTATCFSQGMAVNNNGSAADNSAILDVQSDTANAPKGMLIPRMTTAKRNAIVSPAEGLQIFNLSTKCFEAYIGGLWQNTFCNTGCSAPPQTPGVITGNNNPCKNSTGNIYYISQVAGATSYYWTVPSGASIVMGQGTTGIIVDFGSTAGNITVVAGNNCGISSAQSLAIDLEPEPATAGSISGTASVCQGDMGISYSVPLISGATTYNWSYSGTGFTVASGSGTNSITADFSSGATSGYLTVYGSNSCGNGAVSSNYAITVGSIPSAPAAGTHTALSTEITWIWNTVAGAAGYKWNTVNIYSTATDMGTATSKNETGLTCETAYTRYVWAYNSCGNSTSTSLTKTTASCCTGDGTGGTITHSGGYTIHTFTSNGTFTPPPCVTTVDALLIGGGGGGSGRHGGGGGAGGFLETFGQSVTPLQNYSVVIGSGGYGWASGVSGGIPCGSPQQVPTSGGNSTFAGLTAYGGGGGDGASGGSGAGGGACNMPGGSGVSGQGNSGGASMSGGCYNPESHVGGGGGGANSAGTTATYNHGGDGGSGKSSGMSGASVTYSGGGGGGCYFNGINGKGGTGGGGDAGIGSTPGQNGTPNTGGGGGSGTWNNCTDYRGGDGGSGIVIIRYITP